ncbi:hypothetical protein V2J09_012253 [Rumex salicifolius]
MKREPGFVITFIPRTMNTTADRLAKMGRSIANFDCKIFEDPPVLQGQPIYPEDYIHQLPRSASQSRSPQAHTNSTAPAPENTRGKERLPQRENHTRSK